MFEININAKAFYNYVNSLLQEGNLTEEEYTAMQKFLALDPEVQSRDISQALADNTDDDFWAVVNHLIDGAVSDIIEDNKD